MVAAGDGRPAGVAEVAPRQARGRRATARKYAIVAYVNMQCVHRVRTCDYTTDQHGRVLLGLQPHPPARPAKRLPCARAKIVIIAIIKIIVV